MGPDTKASNTMNQPNTNCKSPVVTVASTSEGMTLLELKDSTYF
jgi:hypothetical protein